MRDESLSPGHAAHLGNKVPAKRRQKEFVTAASPVGLWPTGGLSPGSGPADYVTDKGETGASAHVCLTDEPSEAWFTAQKRPIQTQKVIMRCTISRLTGAGKQFSHQKNRETRYCSRGILFKRLCINSKMKLPF